MVQIIPGQPAKQIESVSEFITNLRRYRKTDVLNIGTDLTWGIFQKRLDFESKLIGSHQVINTFAPKLILMSLATANDHRDNNLTPNQFYNLCHDFLGIKDPISDRSFMDNESGLIVEELRKRKLIPEKYLNQELIREICFTLFIARGIRQQHEAIPSSSIEFCIMHDVLNRLDKITKGQISQSFESIFKMKVLDFLRAAFGLFALGNDGVRKGRIVFQGLTCDKDVVEKWGFNIEMCELVASKISYKESSLRAEWYEEGVLQHHQLYQKFYPTPLYKTPVISMDKNSNKRDYLIPAPQLYMTGVKEAIFSNLYQRIKNLTKLGDAIEDHILCALKSIFGDQKVSRIPSSQSSKAADFLVSLPNCDLIIECKTAVGGYSALSVMSPSDIADVWSKLYGACEQCAASVKDYSKGKKPIVPVILIANHITAEVMPFQAYAMRSGIFDDLGSGYIEFISWSYLCSALAVISVESFEEQLIKRRGDKGTTIRDILTFKFADSSPTHRYEFLEESQNQIFGK